MKMAEIESICIQQGQATPPESITYSVEPYHFELISLGKNQHRTLSDILSGCLMVLPQSMSGIRVADRVIEPGEILPLDGAHVTLESVGDRCLMLVAGVQKELPPRVGLVGSGTKVVQKPWGRELWINGEHPLFSFKMLFLQRGMRTSLQYHRVKRETSLIVEGTGRFIYAPHPLSSGGGFDAKNILTQEVGPWTSMDVPPKCIHRLEAVTDLTLYEVSTPFLDDVVRLADDSGRGHGRILTEHST